MAWQLPGCVTARFLFAGAPSDCDEQRLGDALRTAVEERLQDRVQWSSSQDPFGVGFHGDFYGDFHGDFLKFCFK
jgi:hypothetical protein